MKKARLVLYLAILPITIAEASLAQEWVYTYGQPSTTESANDIAVDASGYVYAAGTDGDFLVVKLDPQNGSQKWLYRYNGPGNGFDEALSIIIDTLSGYIYAAGYSKGNGTGDDFTVVKLSPDNIQQWVYRYNGSGNGQDWAVAIDLDPSGYVYAAGHSNESGTDYNFTVVKIPPTGPPEEWIYRYNGYADGYEDAVDIEVDAFGYSYVAGISQGNGTGSDFTVIKLPPTGSPTEWIYTYNGSANSSDYAFSIALGPSGDVHAAGLSWGSTADYMIVKLSPNDGSELWPPFIDDPFGGPDYARDVAVDKNGYIYSTGVVMTPVQGLDLVIYKLPPSGPPYEWAKVVQTGWGDRGECVVIGSSGIYVGGYLYGDDQVGGGLFAVYKWVPDGTWDGGYIYSYEDSCGYAKAIALDIAANDSEYIYAAGRTYGGNVGGFFIPNLIAVKLTSPIIVPIAEDLDLNTTAQSQTMSVFPNPFSNKTCISYAIHDAGYPIDHISLKIYDATSRVVKNFSLPTSRIPLPASVTWNGTDDLGRAVPAGVYFVRLEAGDHQQTEKAILLR